MNKHEYNQLLKEAKAYQGRRKTRYIDSSEIDTMKRLDRKRSLAGKTIRVYSDSGFVPSSYGYPATIDYVERFYDGAGTKHFAIGQTGASRSGGRGAQVTVNSRAYEG